MNNEKENVVNKNMRNIKGQNQMKDVWRLYLFRIEIYNVTYLRA